MKPNERWFIWGVLLAICLLSLLSSGCSVFSSSFSTSEVPLSATASNLTCPQAAVGVRISCGSFDLQNGSSSQNAVIGSIAVNGASFSEVNNCPSNLGPSQSCTIMGFHTPSGTASESGTLVITGNFKGIDVSLSGTGATPTNATLLGGPRVFYLTGFDGAGFYSLIGRGEFDGIGGIQNIFADITRSAGITSFTKETGTYTISNFRLSASLLKLDVVGRVGSDGAADIMISRDPSGARAVGTITQQTLDSNARNFANRIVAFGYYGSGGGFRFGMTGGFTTGADGNFTNGDVDISFPGISFNAPTTGTNFKFNPFIGQVTLTLTVNSVPQPPSPVSSFVFDKRCYIANKDVLYCGASDRRDNVLIFSAGVNRSVTMPSGGFSLHSLDGPNLFYSTGLVFSLSRFSSSSSVGVWNFQNGGPVAGNSFMDINRDGVISSGRPSGSASIGSNGRGTLRLTLPNGQPQSAAIRMWDLRSAFFLEGTKDAPGDDVNYGYLLPQTLPSPFGQNDAAGTFHFHSWAPAIADAPFVTGSVTATAGNPGSYFGDKDLSLLSGFTPKVPFTGTWSLTDPQLGRASASQPGPGGTTLSFRSYYLTLKLQVGFSTTLGDRFPVPIALRF